VRKPLLQPNYRIRLVHDASVITSKLYPILVKAIDDKALEAYIMRKANWDRRVFNLVYWDAHERAFRRLP